MAITQLHIRVRYWQWRWWEISDRSTSTYNNISSHPSPTTMARSQTISNIRSYRYVPQVKFSLARPAPHLHGRGSGQTRMLHSCLSSLTRHSFCGVLTTGKVYKVCQHSVLINFTHLRNPLTATLIHTLYTLHVVNTPQKLLFRVGEGLAWRD